MPRYIEGNFLPPQGRFAICVARFNGFITEALVSGAVDTLVRHGVADDAIDVYRVPGTYELPSLTRRVSESKRYAGIITLGAVIRGGTPHFDYVCQGVTHGLTQVSVDTGVPIGFGVLTCDTEQQALDRAGLEGSSEDKGHEAVTAAVATAATLRAVSEPWR
jgi:6,7-dimethyl-8-ribityllumazine synthase